MDRLIIFKTAKLAKEKGFNNLNNEKTKLAYVDTRNNDAQTFDYFIVEGLNAEPEAQSCSTRSSWFEGLRTTYILNKIPAGNYQWFLRPTQTTLANWLLEEHGLFISVELAYNEWGRYSAGIFKKAKDGKTAMLAQDGLTIFDNPYDSMEEGLFEALSLI